MIEKSSRNDLDRVGLSEKGRTALDELVTDGYFKDALSCYRLAISISISRKVAIPTSDVIRPTGHMYLISQLDPDGVLGTVIEELFPELGKQKYRTLEKFADFGVLLLKEELQEHSSILFWE